MKTLFLAVAFFLLAVHAAPAGTGQVHTFQGSPAGFLVNSNIVETASGVVVIDSQFLISEARRLKEKIAGIGKPILAVIITHPHPDHFNGTGVLLEGTADVPVYATQATIDGIRESEGVKRAQWKPLYREDYPATTVLPGRTIKAGENLTIDGLTFFIDDLGPGEASDELLLYLPREKALFTGDLIYSRMHPWLAEGRSARWLAQLAKVAEKYASAKVVYPGHGAKGDLGLVTAQKEYLETFRRLISEELAKEGRPTESGKGAVKAEMERRYPGWPLAMLLDRNIAAVAAELATR